MRAPGFNPQYCARKGSLVHTYNPSIQEAEARVWGQLKLYKAILCLKTTNAYQQQKSNWLDHPNIHLTLHSKKSDRRVVRHLERRKIPTWKPGVLCLLMVYKPYTKCTDRQQNRNKCSDLPTVTALRPTNTFQMHWPIWTWTWIGLILSLPSFMCHLYKFPMFQDSIGGTEK